MIVKSHSLMLGYRQFDAQFRRHNGKLVLSVEDIGPISPSDYIKNGFRVLRASTEELQALVQGGYESRTALLRFFSD
ncbi:MAG: hypothetical protein K1X75_08455 [Leptospirales bacterium]|nr:hypothetical protein [Leptospirales bacterium]